MSPESEADYRLLVEGDAFHSPSLRLQVLCAISQLAPILTQVRSEKDHFGPGDVVVSAKITEIKYIVEPEKEGTERVISGYGRCIDIAYLGDAFKLASSMMDKPKH